MKLSLFIIGWFVILATCLVSDPATISDLSVEQIGGYQQLIAAIEQTCDFTKSENCNLTLSEEQKAIAEGIKAERFHLIMSGNNDKSVERRDCTPILYSQGLTCSKIYNESELCLGGKLISSTKDQSILLADLSNHDYVTTQGHGFIITRRRAEKKFWTCFDLRAGDVLYWL